MYLFFIVLGFFVPDFVNSKSPILFDSWIALAFSDFALALFTLETEFPPIQTPLNTFTILRCALQAASLLRV